MPGELLVSIALLMPKAPPSPLRLTGGSTGCGLRPAERRGAHNTAQPTTHVDNSARALHSADHVLTTALQAGKAGVLRVDVLGGRELSAKDHNMFKANSSDPYVILKVGTCRAPPCVSERQIDGKELARTQKVLQSLEPVWNETFALRIADRGALVRVKVGFSTCPGAQVLTLECMDWDKVGRDSLLGTLALALSDLNGLPLDAKWCVYAAPMHALTVHARVPFSDGHPGELHLRMRFEPDDPHTGLVAKAAAAEPVHVTLPILKSAPHSAEGSMVEVQARVDPANTVTGETPTPTPTPTPVPVPVAPQRSIKDVVKLPAAAVAPKGSAAIISNRIITNQQWPSMQRRVPRSGWRRRCRCHLFRRDRRRSQPRRRHRPKQPPLRSTCAGGGCL